MSEEDITTTMKDDNLDPISGSPGSHPVGAGLGATGGGLVGAAIGAVAGPIGSLIGMVAGAVSGGFAGKATAEHFDPTAEDAYWRANFASRPYVKSGESYDTYKPGYRAAYENYGRFDGRTFDEVESEIRLEYEQGHAGNHDVSWDTAKHAARDAWERMEKCTPGTSEREEE